MSTDVAQVAAAMTGNDARALEVQRMSDAIVAATEKTEVATADDGLRAHFKRKFGAERLKAPASLGKVLAVVDGHNKALVEVLGNLNERVKTLEARIAELEAPTMKSTEAVWDTKEWYEPGQRVKWNGSTWKASTRLRGIRPDDGVLWLKVFD